MVTLLLISYLAGAATVIVELRRPASAWVAADRNRSWWITMSVVLSAVGLGLLVAFAYVFSVVLARQGTDETDAAFRKQP